MDTLPKPSGYRDLYKAVSAIQDTVLTAANGDRPGVPNVCIFFTSGRGLRYKFRRYRLNMNCYRTIVIRKGIVADLDKIRDRVCPEAAYFAGMCTFFFGMSETVKGALQKNRCCP